jgi:hypothetical protein
MTCDDGDQSFLEQHVLCLWIKKKSFHFD